MPDITICLNSERCEGVLCEKCLTPLLFDGHPQLCQVCRMAFHEEAMRWTDKTESVVLHKDIGVSVGGLVGA